LAPGTPTYVVTIPAGEIRRIVPLPVSVTNTLLPGSSAR
jgi:hypothetical protein